MLLAHYAVINSDGKNAAEMAIQKLATAGGAGGLILLDSEGLPSVHYNTNKMAFCYRDPISGKIISGP